MYVVIYVIMHGGIFLFARSTISGSESRSWSKRSGSLELSRDNFGDNEERLPWWINRNYGSVLDTRKWLRLIGLLTRQDDSRTGGVIGKLFSSVALCIRILLRWHLTIMRFFFRLEMQSVIIKTLLALLGDVTEALLWEFRKVWCIVDVIWVEKCWGKFRW